MSNLENIQPGDFYKTKSGEFIKIIYVIGEDSDFDDSDYSQKHPLPAPIVGRTKSGQILQWDVGGKIPRDSNWSTLWDLVPLDWEPPKSVV